MCGIAGIIRPMVVSEADSAAVRRMCVAQTHRGPNGEGHFSAPRLVMGMRRLSIIDLAGGMQPLYNEDHTLALIANGEIYNYRELQADLRGRSHHLASGSDCETILHLYEEEGPACLRHLRGMFAFALWDSVRQRLFLARDRMGERPLYVAELPGPTGGLVFASEIKGLLASGLIPFELDPAAVAGYFAYEYVPEPLSPLRGVRKLPAGHQLLIDTAPWRLTQSSYWRMEDAPALDGDPAPLLRETLETVGRLVIRADVPVGVALSGGFDSSLVASLARRSSNDPVHAFSVGYQGRPDNDERHDAKALADHLGLPFHDVEVSEDHMLEAFPSLLYWRDEPIADIAGHGYMALMQAARQRDVPVLLQGQGGDELFWGYPWHRRACAQTRRKLAAQAGRGFRWGDYLHLEGPASMAPYHLKVWVEGLAGVLPSLCQWRRDRAAAPERGVFLDAMPFFMQTVAMLDWLMPRAALASIQAGSGREVFDEPIVGRDADIALTAAVCRTYLIGNGLAQADRLAMACSVEGRLPLLDHVLVERVIGLRKRAPDGHLPAKSWLHAAARPLLPDWVYHRPKRGFTPPVMRWQRVLLDRYAGDLIDGCLVRRGVLTPPAARELARGASLRGVQRLVSFRAVVLEQWCRMMSGEVPAPASPMSLPIARVTSP